ncbi:hypothetical protein DN752_16250 [Echinicola strongylocentroti]|uniref:Uncharacterized protein n=1 Tax=Echinicola strongylocentroti TaxID=1795355 RepID=A0A2Z4IKA3_9BACT|nr:hypothetical protein [Echinicola strongylocentroti]AWW31551.1 hypothetical protein DN752_16250 [Echinicola strongylocentroti]
MRLIVISLIILCFSCHTSSEERKPTLAFHSKSDIGEAQLWVITTGYDSTTDSTTFHLSEDGSAGSFKWKPSFKGSNGEGFLVVGVVGEENLTDTINHYYISYPSGVLIDPEYWVTITDDSLSFEKF